MNKPRIFLGSSGKQAKLLQAITRGLEDVADVEPWTTTFNPGRSTLDRLVELSQEVDFAAFVFAQDDWTTTDAPQSGQASPRDNVVFEAGLFGGALGIRRTFILHAHGSKLPSDLLGLTSVRYDPATSCAAGYWTTRSDRDAGLNARTAGVYLRADPSDLQVLDSGSEEERAQLIAQRLQESKSAANGGGLPRLIHDGDEGRAHEARRAARERSPSAPRPSAPAGATGRVEQSDRAATRSTPQRRRRIRRQLGPLALIRRTWRQTSSAASS